MLKCNFDIAIFNISFIERNPEKMSIFAEEFIRLV